MFKEFDSVEKGILKALEIVCFIALGIAVINGIIGWADKLQ